MINKKIFPLVLLLVSGCLAPVFAVPIITREELVTIADDHVVITWQTTNEAANSSVRYGFTNPPTTTYSTDTASNQTKYHYLRINNLLPNNTYYYRIYSESASGTTESIIRTVKTLERPAGNYLFTFATMSDIHYAPNKDNTTNDRGRPYNSSEAIVSGLVAAINQAQPAFTLIKGDMIDAGVNNPTDRVNQLKTRLDTLSTAYYPIPGNHDKAIDYGAGNNWVKDNLRTLYPAGPAVAATTDCGFNYNITTNGYRFVMLDSSTANGVTAEVNLTSLEAELVAAQTAKQKVFIFMHHEASAESGIPTEILRGILDLPDWNDSDWDRIRISNSQSFFNLITSYKLANNEPVVGAVFCGHIHDSQKRTIGGIPIIRTPSGLQFPTGYNVYKVYSNGFIQSFYKLPGYSEEISRDLIVSTGEVDTPTTQQFYLGGTSLRNFTITYSANNTTVPPTVESIMPVNGASGVPLNQPIIINFTKPMTKEGEVSSWITLTAGGSPVTINSSEWSWNSSKTRLTINKTLTASQNYVLTIVGGLSGATATDGTFFLADAIYTFTSGTTSDTTPPLCSIYPLTDENGTVTNTTSTPTPILVGIATDEIGLASIETRIDSGSWGQATPVNGKFLVSNESFVVNFTSALRKGEHTLELRGTDNNGNTNILPYSYYVFTVADERPSIALKVNGVTPIPGDSIASTPRFQVTVTSLHGPITGRLTLNDGPHTLSFVNVNANYYATLEVTTALSAGPNTVTVEAFDVLNAGTTLEISPLYVNSNEELDIVGIPLNYPNPFDPGSQTAAISYTLNKPANVTLTFHDLGGRLIARKNYSAGENGGRAGYNEITWDGRSDTGQVLGNGIYIYLLIADGKMLATGKLTVVKR
jgi:hypothetical protein